MPVGARRRARGPAVLQPIGSYDPMSKQQSYNTSIAGEAVLKEAFPHCRSRSPSRLRGTPARPGGVVERGDMEIMPPRFKVVEAPEGPSTAGGTYIVVFLNDAEVTIAVG